MKIALQLATSTLALAGLLAGAASHATNLAELPLKMSVLAKPNVIFGMDDSGSMDWEVLLSTDSGLAYWNGTTAFDSATNKPLANSAMPPMAYLFPLGSASGGQLYAYNNWYGQAAPPSTQFAWLRSAAFNKLYYNTATTYKPWSPAYVNSAFVASYPPASTTAASAHPAVAAAPTYNLSASWNSASTNYSSNGYMFYMQAGMVVPSGSYVSATSDTGGACEGGGSWRTTTAAITVANNRACWAAIPYHAATFWHAEDCTIGSDCVLAPDGTTKLKRYEIKSTTASYPSGRTYADELQNFANWFTYHRKRKLMLAASMGSALENITGLRMAVMPFASSPTLSMFDADSASNATNRFAISGLFYTNAMAANGTPTHATMKRIGTQFDTNANIIQYACQRNSMFVVTDGFANAHAETAPAYSQATYGGSAPHATTPANSLADFALAYYTNRLRTGLAAGKVPSGDPARVNPDLNTNLHVTTYAITLGVRGSLFPNAADPFATDIFASPPTWPAPVADTPSMIDDLWHATVNGRGKMYLASDTNTTSAAIQSALSDILSQAGAQSGVAVSSVNLVRGDSQAYLAAYNPSGWSGDLTANAINTTTAAISNVPTWTAASLLSARAWSTRVLFSSSGGAGAEFTAANVGAALNPEPATFTDSAVVDYLRGNRTGEGSTFRQRTSLIGAVVNAEPVLAREESTVYVASGEGMVHAFDTTNGRERWAYAPAAQLVNIGKSIKRGWVYQTLLDGTPVYGRLSNGSKLLVGGLGAAGRGYYALDVSAPGTTAVPLTEAQAKAQFKWTFPDAANAANMGYTVGKPVIARTQADGNVVLVTSGYDNGQSIGDGKGRLWMLNASTGAVIKTFVTTAGAVGAESGLAHVAAYKEADGNVTYVYGGDLLGNVWRFDLTTAGAGEHNGFLLTTLRDSSNNPQPVTSTPELALKEGKRIVLVGTGRLLDVGDFGDPDTQSFYAIADPNGNATTLTNARSGLIARTFSRGADTLSGAAFNWATDRGWYFDMPAGEQANTDPALAFGTVVFVTNVAGATDCSQSAYMYFVDLGTGSKPVATPSFPNPLASKQLSASANASRPLLVKTRDGKVVSISRCTDATVCTGDVPPGGSILPAKNAWKEVRR